MARNGIQQIVVLAIILILSACGIDRGGIDTFVPLDPTPGSLTQAGTVSGAITNIDVAGLSVTINGKVLNLSSSVIYLNGVTDTLSSIAEGQFATTFSSVSVLSPQEIRVDLNIAGGEVTFDPDASTFDLLGQSVMLSNLSGDANAPSLPQAGLQTLAVSGYVTSEGLVDATSIVPYESSLPDIVTAFTSQVDATNFTFEFGTQLFDYSEAISITTSSGMVNENERIRVVLSPTQNSNAVSVSTLDASPLIDPRLLAGALVSLTGYVSSPISNGELEVSFIPMTTNSDTSFVNLVASELTLNRLVTVEGLLQADGSVMLQMVSLVN